MILYHLLKYTRIYLLSWKRDKEILFIDNFQVDNFDFTTTITTSFICMTIHVHIVLQKLLYLLLQLIYFANNLSRKSKEAEIIVN